MKIKIIILLLLLQPWELLSCDVCGCSASANDFGILPQFNKNFVGLRYKYRDYFSNHPSESNELQTVPSNEYYNSAEIWTRIFLSDNVQLYAFVPFQYYKQSQDTGDRNISGIGDISILANLILYETNMDSCSEWKHLVQVGAGIKLPTGKNDGSETNQNFQIGTGSVDIPMNAIYTLRYNSLGLNSEITYSINTDSPKGYRFGNRSAAAIRAFYWQDIDNIALLPSLGISYEHSSYDLMNGFKQDYTGGDILSSNIGLDLYWQNYAFGFNYVLPIQQDLGSGYIKMNNKLMANITYLF